METSNKSFQNFLQENLNSEEYKIYPVIQGFLISKNNNEPVLFKYNKSNIDKLLIDLRIPLLRVFNNLLNEIIKELDK